MQSLGNGYNAVIIGSTGGIGNAIAAAVESDPRCGRIWRLARSGGDDHLDLLDEASVEQAASQTAEQLGEIDLLIDATGTLHIDGQGPEKALSQIEPAAMAQAFAVNAIGPALLFKHFAPLLPRDRRAIFATLAARIGSIGDNRIGGWISYRASKAALNQIVRTASIEIGRRSPEAVCVSLHPGTVETPLSRPFVGSRDVFSPDESAAKLLSVLDGLTPEKTGWQFAYDGRRVPE
ncbi:MAG TPA: SDR family NAD(P)-dependent oxidoreductase [Alphaproteobacteria bacterium]|nr:SDR family NAD(P)-dependent oxidoreductase [Alphaproteobacteria bacterium]